MNRIPALIATTAAALVFTLAPAAHADGPPDPAGPTTEFCQTIPALWLFGHPVTPELEPCIPWPF
jgi:hypothetical protein